MHSLHLLHKKSRVFDACTTADYDKLIEAFERDRDDAQHDVLHYRHFATQRTPLLEASFVTHNPDLVLLLLQHNASIEDETEDGSICLHLAAKAGREDVLQALLSHVKSKDLDVDHRNAEGTTPLMCAVFAGDLPCCKVLVKAGAWIDARNKLGQTCLMKATCYRDMRMIEWLLKEGADPTLRDKEQKKALDYSEERNFDEVTRVLRGERTILKDDMWDDALEDELSTLETAF
eukprot:g3195.t1